MPWNQFHIINPLGILGKYFLYFRHDSTYSPDRMESPNTSMASKYNDQNASSFESSGKTPVVEKFWFCSLFQKIQSNVYIKGKIKCQLVFRCAGAIVLFIILSNIWRKRMDCWDWLIWHPRSLLSILRYVSHLFSSRLTSLPSHKHL